MPRNSRQSASKRARSLNMPSATILLAILIILPSVLCDYWTDREAFVQNEASQAIGGGITLNDIENKANEVLMQYKQTEIQKGKENLKNYAASQHFFQSKPLIKSSNVFQIIKNAPKGAVLHTHDTSMGSTELLFNLTYTKDLYTCWHNSRLQFRFFKQGNVDTTCQWVDLEELRKKSKNIDNEIKKEFSLVVKNPFKTYPDGNAAWGAFKKIFGSVTPFLTYKPVWENYFYGALEEFYNDNIRYVELRSTLPNLYDIDGRVYDELDVVSIYKQTVDVFKQSHRDFIGVRIIYAPSRRVDNKTMDNYIAIMQKLKRNYPDFVAGFDLVGQEDMGQPLVNFIDKLLQLKNINVSFFFHAGETNWQGSIDQNLIDAVLLGTKRIGHGFALTKHPEVLKEVLKQGIGIEVCPISNQVLRLVDDLRNHPASSLIAGGYPVVIANDDPSFWGAKGLSYDWYVALMGLAGENGDLRFLKQIALNSFIYSSMKADEKNKAILQWGNDWNDFVKKLSQSADEYSVIMH